MSHGLTASREFTLFISDFMKKDNFSVASGNQSGEIASTVDNGCRIQHAIKHLEYWPETGGMNLNTGEVKKVKP